MAVAASASVSVPSGGSGSAFLEEFTVRVTFSASIGWDKCSGNPCEAGGPASATGRWNIYAPPVNITRDFSGSGRWSSGCIPSAYCRGGGSVPIQVFDSVTLEDGRAIIISGTISPKIENAIQDPVRTYPNAPFTVQLISGIDAADIQAQAPLLAQLTGVPQATIKDYAREIADAFNAAGVQLSQFGAPGAATFIIPAIQAVLPATAAELIALRALYSQATGIIPENYLPDTVMDALANWMQSARIPKTQAFSDSVLDKIVSLAYGYVTDIKCPAGAMLSGADAQVIGYRDLVQVAFGPRPDVRNCLLGPNPEEFNKPLGCWGFGFHWSEKLGACFASAEEAAAAERPSVLPPDEATLWEPAVLPIEEQPQVADEVAAVAGAILTSASQLAEATGFARAQVVAQAREIARRLVAEGYTAFEVQTDAVASSRAYEVTAEVLGGGGFPTVPVVVALAGAGVLALVLMRRRKRS